MTKAYLLGFICAATGGTPDQCPFEDSRWYLPEFELWNEGFGDGKDPKVDSLMELVK